MNNNLLILALVSLFMVSCSNDSKKATSAKDLYTKNCIACHGVDGKKGMATAADLSVSKLSIEEQNHIVTNGKGMMAPFKLSLKANEIDSIVTYIQGLRK